MNIICACDDSYVPFCGAMLTSVFENNKKHDITVYVMSSNLGKENKNKFEKLASSYHQNIVFLLVDSELYEDLPIGNFVNITKETYYRLSIPSILKDINRVLYLDCDMIVRHDLEELYCVDLENVAVCAIQDSLSMTINGPSRLNYDNSYSYYNSGMGLWNLDFMRKTGFETKVGEFISKNMDKIIYHDQDILNSVCRGQYKETSVRWNMLSCFLMQKPDISRSRLADLNKWIEDPGIIHYSAKYKPWNTECEHPYKMEFWKYVKMSPWSDLQETKKFNGKDSFVVWAKRRGKRIMSLLGWKEYEYRKLILR